SDGRATEHHRRIPCRSCGISEGWRFHSLSGRRPHHRRRIRWDESGFRCVAGCPHRQRNARTEHRLQLLRLLLMEPAMQTTTVYSYDRATGEYRGQAVAQPNPRRPGAYLLPAFSTETAPPPVGERETTVYRNGEWAVVPDW